MSADAAAVDDPFASLDPAQWREARPGVHLLAQILGKVSLAAQPFRNHWWEVGLQLTPTGFRSPLLMVSGTAASGQRFELDADLVHSRLHVRTTVQTTALTLDGSLTVAAAYARLLALLADQGIQLELDPVTAEMTPPIHLDQDQTALAVGVPAVRAWLRHLHLVDAAYAQVLRTFYGKTSGGLLYFGALDYAVSLYNGKTNTPPAGSNQIYSFAENAENITFSYWTTSDGAPQLAAYRMPGRASDAGADYSPGEWSTSAGEVVCRLTPTGAVAADSGSGAMVTFLNHTQRTLAHNGDWDLPALLGPVPPGW